MDSGATADCPSLGWRAMSNTTMWGVAGLCRAFLSVLSTAEVHGGDAFTALLDSRRDPSQRKKGLITGTYTGNIEKI
jgi:monolysocardiolipin acyltransferase